jgi:hypothetical protein
MRPDLQNQKGYPQLPMVNRGNIPCVMRNNQLALAAGLAMWSDTYIMCVLIA